MNMKTLIEHNSTSDLAGVLCDHCGNELFYVRGFSPGVYPNRSVYCKCFGFEGVKID